MDVNLVEVRQLQFIETQCCFFLLLRYILKNDLPIVWQQWVDCIEWDRSTNSRLIHHRVTQAHLNPSNPEKMRNQLAEDMMGEDMLNVMIQYQVKNFILVQLCR